MLFSMTYRWLHRTYTLHSISAVCMWWSSADAMWFNAAGKGDNCRPGRPFSYTYKWHQKWRPKLPCGHIIRNRIKSKSSHDYTRTQTHITFLHTFLQNELVKSYFNDRKIKFYIDLFIVIVILLFTLIFCKIPLELPCSHKPHAE